MRRRMALGLMTLAMTLTGEQQEKSMCFICGRGNCLPSFHSLEEQNAYEKAGDAFERYLEIRAQCESEYNNADCEDVDEDIPHFSELKGIFGKAT